MESERKERMLGVGESHRMRKCRERERGEFQLGPSRASLYSVLYCDLVRYSTRRTDLADSRSTPLSSALWGAAACQVGDSDIPE